MLRSTVLYLAWHGVNPPRTILERTNIMAMLPLWVWFPDPVSLRVFCSNEQKKPDLYWWFQPTSRPTTVCFFATVFRKKKKRTGGN